MELAGVTNTRPRHCFYEPCFYEKAAGVLGLFVTYGIGISNMIWTESAGLATSAAEREQLGDPKLTRLFRQRFLHETRLELSIALARGKALMIDAARDKLAGITAQRARASPQ